MVLLLLQLSPSLPELRLLQLAWSSMPPLLLVLVLVLVLVLLVLEWPQLPLELLLVQLPALLLLQLSMCPSLEHPGLAAPALQMRPLWLQAALLLWV